MSRAEYQREWRKRRHPKGYAKNKYRARKGRGETGWTAEEYDAAYERQAGCCAMCGRHANTMKVALHADHCHHTGKMRGLLCIHCNSRVEPVLTRYMLDPDFRSRWNAYLSSDIKSDWRKIQDKIR